MISSDSAASAGDSYGAGEPQLSACRRHDDSSDSRVLLANLSYAPPSKVDYCNNY